jgi:hypothetical protein
MVKFKETDEWTRAGKDAARSILLEPSPYDVDGGEAGGSRSMQPPSRYSVMPLPSISTMTPVYCGTCGARFFGCGASIASKQASNALIGAYRRAISAASRHRRASRIIAARRTTKAAERNPSQ